MPTDSLLTDFLTDDEARTLYGAGDAAHDFDHVLRVTQMALRLAHAEGANAEIVRLAALLHDLPVPSSPVPSSPKNGEQATERMSATERKRHHFAAAVFARQILSQRGMATVAVENVVHCIEAHRFRDHSVQPQTLEAQCLYDADKLDAIGAIGIARAFAFAGTHAHRLWTTPWPQIGEAPALLADYTPVHEFVFKLRRLRDTLYTASARKIGQERHDFMTLFFDHLDREAGETSVNK